MTPEQARQAVADALRQAAPDIEFAAIANDEDLREAAGLDSLDFLTFVEWLSATTGIRIDEDDYPALRTVSSTVEFLCERDRVAQ